MRNILAIAAVTLLAGCASTGGPASRSEPIGVPYVLTAAETKVVEEGVRGDLKDPNSAMFGRMVATRAPADPTSTTVCGFVNAKNSFGGYTGDKPFMGLMASDESGKPLFFRVTGMGGTDTETMAVMMVCRDYGVAL